MSFDSEELLIRNYPEEMRKNVYKGLVTKIRKSGYARVTGKARKNRLIFNPGRLIKLGRTHS